MKLPGPTSPFGELFGVFDEAVRPSGTKHFQKVDPTNLDNAVDKAFELRSLADG
jgi:hypothetical protein